MAMKPSSQTVESSLRKIKEKMPAQEGRALRGGHISVGMRGECSKWEKQPVQSRRAFDANLEDH